MQIPGTPCKICGANLLVALEGTWCTQCSSVFHTSCLTKAAFVCPKCEVKYTPPAQKELLDACGRIQHEHAPIPRDKILSTSLQVVVGALLVLSPVVWFVLASGVALSFDKPNGAAALFLAVMSIPSLLLGVTLLVNAQREN